MKDREESLVIDGIELQPKDVAGCAWTYVPLRPALERGQSGAPMLQVIEAGSTAFLQCTARVALHEEARAALLTSLKKKQPQAETLEAAPLSVERIALEVMTGNDWVAVAESKGSDLPPWTAALAATLASGQLAALKSALAGEKKRARLTARIVLPGASASFRSAKAAGEARIKTPTGAASMRFSATADESSPASQATRRNLAADIADFFPPGKSNR